LKYNSRKGLLPKYLQSLKAKIQSNYLAGITMTDQNPYDSPQSDLPVPPTACPSPYSGPALSGFDRFCAVIAFALGIVLLILGGFGLFVGCNANFTLPPILGAVPALVGWGIVKSVRVAWRIRRGYAPPFA
jgi:hypothetical protein